MTKLLAIGSALICMGSLSRADSACSGKPASAAPGDKAPAMAGSEYFSDFPAGRTPEEVGLRLTERFLATPHTVFGNIENKSKPGMITYPDVCTWLGGLWFAKATDNTELFEQLKDRFEPLLNDEKHLQPKPNHVDNNIFGALPLELYLATGEEYYLDLGLMYADTQWEIPGDFETQRLSPWANGGFTRERRRELVIEKGYSWQMRLWLDDMFVITCVQARAFKATGDPRYVERCAKQMAFYLDELQQENGLFPHSPDTPFCWGRGTGWLAVGITEVLRNTPLESPYRARILDGYRKMAAALLKHQAEDGMWRQIVDDPKSWKETSGTAMFTYSMITGVREGWLNADIYGSAARKAWLSLVDYIDENDNLREVCTGTNIGHSREHYMNRPRVAGDLHGQAPMLWCAMVLVRD